jgi:hypothetical protein
MSGDLEDFGEQVLLAEILKKFDLDEEKDYFVRIGVDRYKKWAYNFGKRNIEHAYEDPWKKGWIAIRSESEKEERKFRWEENGEGTYIIEKKEAKQ